ncbi:hypothetical protein B0F90DRAFT_1667420 [Multifurca ochricompacta]|uniref:Uncharacterized protein n=1 Tax=Multifurca ochricompacta TaxID=376703 RepID=A0AAD4QLS1_9AGAM|nr:hypothetical protein B0F90DRAFT_1667420 [Multifurca ochricompacta]
MASSRVSRSVPAKNFMMNLPSRALRIFDNTTNAPNSYPTPAAAEQKSNGALTHIPNASKAPTLPIDTFFNPSNYVHRSAIDSAYEQKKPSGSRKFGIYPSAAKNTFVYEASVSSKSDFYDDGDSFFSAPDDASILARSSLETLQSVFGIGNDGSDSDGSDHSPSRIVPPNLPALIEAQKNYNAGIISVALPEGSVSSDSDTDSTITEGPYTGQNNTPDATAMQRYYAMMSSRPPPVSEDRRILPPPVQSQPQNSIIGPRAPVIPQTPGVVGLARQPALIQRRQDIQTPMPRDSLVLPPAAPMQRQDSGYTGRTMIPRRPSLEREQRQILPPGLSTSPAAHSNMTGQPSAPPTYTPGRPRRDSLPPSAPAPVQSTRRDSVSAVPQPPVQPVRRDSVAAAPQPPPQSARRDSVPSAPQLAPQAIHRNSLSSVSQPPVLVHRATDPLPAANSAPQVPVRRASDPASRGQGHLVSTRVRFNDENLICPSPIPMHSRRKGWHNRRGDQLWTNKGDYKPTLPGNEYPPDLANYPDYGEGWMNEEGVRIDMQHRLIPKPPLRSVLKRPRQPSNAGANPSPPFLQIRP